MSDLSERERAVVQCIVDGLSNKEIAARLVLADKTVKNHVSHILAKIHCASRTQIAVYALRNGLAT